MVKVGRVWRSTDIPFGVHDLQELVKTYMKAIGALSTHISDLGWEYDRMSEDGKDSLKAIDKILNDLSDGLDKSV